MAFKTRFWILVTIVLAALAGFLVHNYLNEIKKASIPQEVMGTQVLARVRIPTGTKVTQDMLETKKIPEKYAVPSAIAETQEALGKYAVSDIWPGQPIVAQSLTTTADANELPFKIPRGMRAISLAVDEVSGAAGHVKPGHHVDVIAVVSNEDRSKLISLTLIENALVLAVGPDLRKKDGVQTASTVTLAVTPEEALREALSERSGTLKLSVRSIGDGAIEGLPSVDIKRLLNMYP